MYIYREIDREGVGDKEEERERNKVRSTESGELDAACVVGTYEYLSEDIHLFRSPLKASPPLSDESCFGSAGREEAE